MTDEQTTTALRDAMSATVHDHRLAPDAAAVAWRAAHSPRQQARHHLAIAASVVVVALIATALALWSSGRDPRGNSAADRSACAGTVTTAPLPDWARGGFTAAGVDTPHVASDRGQIIAVLFVPLRVHQPAGTDNKVLWVARNGSGPLHISAHLPGTSQTVIVDLPDGPGPSYVNMPVAGCWQMSLTWAGYRDTIALQYQP